MADTYFTIERSSIAEFKDRGSRFIAYAFPIQSADELKQRLSDIKKEHPKATHHCFAYRLGTEGYNFRVSDDGEPSGSAGRPILGQIDNRQLTNTLVVVVRYFGGSLLGIPGLINAYKTATMLCLQVTPVVVRSIAALYQLQFPYTQLDAVLKVLKHMGLTVLKKDIQLFCNVTVSVPLKDVENLERGLGSMEGLTITRQANS
ncbi:MAG TPA: YigZ family protein [Chitinophagaceae bacterium]|nr:YigZ family protein [Chitinophagaceae bacterium]